MNDYFSVPEDPTSTSVILDNTTYQRLSQAARSNPKEVHERDIQQTKRNQELIEVNHLLKINFYFSSRMNLIDVKKRCKSTINNEKKILH
jgi:hypothetical protein